MPIIKRQQLWTRVPLPVVYAVTTNAETNRHGEIVMGRGAAKQAKDRIPGIAREVALKVVGRRSYYWVVVREPSDVKAGFGVFQVKFHWAKPASLGLIDGSVRALCEWCAQNPDVAVRMNYPGIGNGGLDRADVEPLLAPLPDSVTVCYL